MICCFWFVQKQDPMFTYEVIVVDDGSQDQTSQVSVCALEQLVGGKLGAV